MSPWPIMFKFKFINSGGVGIAGVRPDEFILPVHAKPGD